MGMGKGEGRKEKRRVRGTHTDRVLVHDATLWLVRVDLVGVGDGADGIVLEDRGETQMNLMDLRSWREEGNAKPTVVPRRRMGFEREALKGPENWKIQERNL